VSGFWAMLALKLRPGGPEAMLSETNSPACFGTPVAPDRLLHAFWSVSLLSLSILLIGMLVFTINSFIGLPGYGVSVHSLSPRMHKNLGLVFRS